MLLLVTNVTLDAIVRRDVGSDNAYDVLDGDSTNPSGMLFFTSRTFLYSMDYIILYV